MTKFFGAAVAFAAASVGIAVASSDLKGVGTAPCGQIRSLYDRADFPLREEIVSTLGQWAFGYMSGRNAEAASHTRRDLESFGSDETGAFILSACGEFPGLYVYQVVEAIYQEAPLMGPGV